MGKHTPGPWTANGDMVNTKKDCLYVAKCAGDTDEQAEANAEFIVRACNCHDELVEACKEFLKLEKFTSSLRTPDPNGCWGDLCNAFAIAKSAISKAEGK